MPTHDVFGSRPPTSRKQESLCPRFFLVFDTARFSPAHSYSTRLTGCHAQILGHDATACCTTYCKLACLVWDTKKGVHGCLVASPRADVLGEESAGPMEMGAQPDGPAPGREPWGSRWFVPRGKPQLPSVLGSTGWYRFLGASPGWSRALLALLALLVLIGCAPLITSFGAGGCCWWLWLPIPHSPIPISPRRPMWSYTGTPQIPRCGQGQVSTGVRSKDMRTVIRRLPVESLQVLQKV